MNNEKFLLTLTKGNDRTILVICGSKAEAITKGEEFRKHLPMDSGTLSVIYAEIDDENKIIDGKYRLYHSWL